MTAISADEHRNSPGDWPAEFPVNPDGYVEEGLVVWSRLGLVEGRTTGARLRVLLDRVPRLIHRCHVGDGPDDAALLRGLDLRPGPKTVRITGGGEISARVISPEPLGTPPSPRSEWPTRESLRRRKGSLVRS